MSEAGEKSIKKWDRIRPASGTVLSPQISAIHFRRSLSEAVREEQCADLCQNSADVILKEVPATLVTSDGNRVELPREIDTQHLEVALANLHLSRVQIRFLVNSRLRLALCLDCARKRVEGQDSGK